MQIPKSLKPIGDFAGTFSLNALEGATLTSIVTFGPHLFQRYVHPGFTPLLDIPKAIAYTVMGAVGYSAYKTILEPASSNLNKSITDIPKNITKFATDVIFPKADKVSEGKPSSDKRKVKDSIADIYGARDNPTLRDKKIDDLSSSWFSSRNSKKNEKASLYSTTLWSLGTLSAFGGVYSLTSNWFESPVIPLIASTTISLGGSYYLNKGVVHYGKKIADGAKKSDLFQKTCEAVEKVWTFGGTSLKLTILASGIWGANGLRENIVDPVVNSKVTNGSIKSASMLWEWTTYAADTLSSAVGAVAYKVSPLYDFMFNSASECFNEPTTYDAMYDAINSGTKHISEMDLPPHTPEECRRIFENKDFITSYIKPVWDFTASGVNQAASGVKFGFGLLGSGLYIASGLVFRKDTLDECENISNYKENNPFLCTNAERIDSFIDNVFTNILNPVGNILKSGTLSTYEGLSSIFNKTWSVTMTSASIVSGLIYREQTLSDCAGEAFKSENEFLCTNAGRIETLFKDYLNPFGSKVSEGFTYAKDGISSTFNKSWTATTAGVGIISGLIYREATLEQCGGEEGFKAANEFLCTNAQRIETLFVDYLNPLGESIAEHAIWAKDGAVHYGSIAGTALVDAALDPTVQNGALAAVGTGAALYGLHVLATKVQEHYAAKTIPPIHGIDQEPPVQNSDLIDPKLVNTDADGIPPRRLEEPSAPPIELMPVDEESNLDSVSSDVAPTTDVAPSEEINPPLELPPINTDLVREEAPVSLLSKIGNIFKSITSGVKAWAYTIYTSLTQLWNNLWTKQPIEKN
jgi:hypothetical protein